MRLLCIAGGPLPYLHVRLNFLKLAAEENRLLVVSEKNKTVLQKKITQDGFVRLDLGFTDDIKGRVTPYEYTITFLSTTKVPQSKIVLYFEEDGTYFVNGEKHGKI